MRIVVNGEAQEVADDATIFALFQTAGTEQKTADFPSGVAVAVNEEVVPRDEWSSKELHDNDSVLIITATQGG